VYRCCAQVCSGYSLAASLDIGGARFNRMTMTPTSLCRGLVLLLGFGCGAVANGAEIEARLDLDYAGGKNPRQSLDLYLPAVRTAPLPVVVFIHGGGWQGGSKTAGKTWLQPLVASGDYAGASIGYRLSGEARWPAPIHDAKAAIRWLRAHAAELGLDGRRIAVAGVSAGGTIAVLLGVAGDVPELEGSVGAHVGVDSRVQAVANLYGRINFLAEPESARAAPDQAAALNQRLRQLFGGTLEEKRDLVRMASPITHVSAGDAPVITLHGTADALVPIAQAEELDAALRRAGVEHRFVRMVGFGHGFQHAEGNRRVREFFDRHLRGRDADVSVAPIVAPAKK